ncbi:hypothetical protein SCANM63S_02594 [Streptomyces canarius]
MSGERPGEVAADQRGQRLGIGNGPRQGREPAQLGRGQAVEHAQQEGRIALRRGCDLVAHPRVEPVLCDVVQQGGGVRRGQGSQAQQRQAGELRVHGAVSGDGEQEGDTAPVGQVSGESAECGSGGGVPQVGVVDAQENGPVRGRGPQATDEFPHRVGGADGGCPRRVAQRADPGQRLPALPGAGAHGHDGPGGEGAGDVGEESRAAAPRLAGHGTGTAATQPVRQRCDHVPLGTRPVPR